MKPKLVIGTVAGLISLTTATKASIMVSPITNQLLNIDLDGDSVIDFQVHYYNVDIRDIVGLSGNLVADTATFARRYNFGETILFSDPTYPDPDIDNLFGVGTSYVGVKFAIGGGFTSWCKATSGDRENFLRNAKKS